MNLKLGICLNIDEEFQKKLQFAKQTGFDYIELSLSKIASLDEESFENIITLLEDNKMKASALNVFLPGDIRLTGNEISTKVTRDYLDFALERASKIGAKTIVFGSGGARNVPENFSHDLATIQIIDFLKLVSEKLEKYNINLAIEHLNKKECNILNSVEECFDVAQKVNKKNIQLLVDTYHLYLENESCEILKKIYDDGGKFIHLHIADALKNRAYPTDIEPFYEFVDFIKYIDYEGCLSIEGNTTDFYNDLPISFDLLKKI